VSAVDLLDRYILYAGQSPRVFESHTSIYKFDRGWQRLAIFEGMSGVTALELDMGALFQPDRRNVIYAGLAGTPGKLMRSTDGGKSWRKPNEALSFSNIHAIAADPYHEGMVFPAPWGGGLFVSADFGAT
jgi:hypothetical protein